MSRCFILRSGRTYNAILGRFPAKFIQCQKYTSIQVTSSASLLRCSRVISCTTRCLSSQISPAGTEVVKTGKVTSEETPPEILPVLDTPEEEDLYREKYVPLTRKTLVRLLMERKDFLTPEECSKFEDFTIGLDRAIINKYHDILQEIKVLFDPINPDLETVQGRKVTRREKLDNEFWLIQRLEDLMTHANFHELPRSAIDRLAEVHEAREGVMVKINPDKYDILRYWVLGKEVIPVGLPWYKRVSNRLTKTPPPAPIEYYKRVIVAVRLKKDSKLLLKSFKEVPVNALEMLLPDGDVSINKLDRAVLVGAGGIAVTGIVAKIVTLLAHIQFDWTLLLTGVTGLIAVQAWTTYKNRCNLYLVDLNRMLYFKNIANNRGLLTLLVDRAQDESFKEALLAFTFLLTNRPPSAAGVTQLESGDLTDTGLEKAVETFVKKATGMSIEFDSDESVKLLQNFGLLSHKNERLHVLSLDAAIRNLPRQPDSLIARVTSVDAAEGYDRDYFEETEEEYKDDERRNKHFGWFSMRLR